MTAGPEQRGTPGWSLSLWAGFWVFMCTVTHVPITHRGPFSVTYSDKAVHFAMYFILAWLGGRRLARTYGSYSVGWLVFWALAYTAYAAVDEWVQPFFGRTMSWWDWVADVAGVIAATSWLLYKRTSTMLSEPSQGPDA